MNALHGNDSAYRPLMEGLSCAYSIGPLAEAKDLVTDLVFFLQKSHDVFDEQFEQLSDAQWAGFYTLRQSLGIAKALAHVIGDSANLASGEGQAADALAAPEYRTLMQSYAGRYLIAPDAKTEDLAVDLMCFLESSVAVFEDRYGELSGALWAGLHLSRQSLDVAKALSDAMANNAKRARDEAITCQSAPSPVG